MIRYLLYRRNPPDQDASPRRTSSRVLEVTGQACGFLDVMYGSLGLVIGQDRTALEFELAGGRAPGEYLLIREDIDTSELDAAKQHYRNTDAALREAHERVEQLNVEIAKMEVQVARVEGEALEWREKYAAVVGTPATAGMLGDPDE